MEMRSPARGIVMQKGGSINFIGSFAHGISMRRDSDILPLLQRTKDMVFLIRLRENCNSARLAGRSAVLGSRHDRMRRFAGETALRGPNRRIASRPADEIQNA